MPLAPFGVALQSFPFPRSRTRSRGPNASLRVRVRPHASAAGPRRSRQVSPSRRPFAAARPFGLAGRGGRDDGSSQPLDGDDGRASALAGASSFSTSPGSPGTWPARPLRSFALLESPFAPEHCPGQGGAPGSVLSWVFVPSRVCSVRPWVRFYARAERRTGAARLSSVCETPALHFAKGAFRSPSPGV